jgi:hypothetical protein
MRPTYRLRILIWVIAALMVAAIPGVAFAGDGDPTSETDEYVITEVLATVPVLGAGLDLTITRGLDGAIESVALDPAAGATVLRESDHKVVFLLADGNTEVKIKSKDGRVQTKVSADSTADVTGPGSWSADVFGNGVVTVPYTVSFNGNAPTITVGQIVVPAGVTAEIGEPRIDSDDGEEFYYRISVSLTSGEEGAKLTLKAKTEIDEGDGEVEVRVAASLSDRDHHRDHDDDGEREKWDGKDDDHDSGGDRDRDRSDDRGDDDDDDGGDRDDD